MHFRTPGKIIFAGVGKTRDEMALALKAGNTGIAQFNVESEPELQALSEVAAGLGLRAPVAIRINPDIDAKTHKKITRSEGHTSELQSLMRTSYAVFCLKKQKQDT